MKPNRFSMQRCIHLTGKNLFLFLCILTTAVSSYSQTEKTDSLPPSIEKTQVPGCEDFFDYWLAGSCATGDYVFNGALSNPVNGSPTGGDVWRSCMWNTYTAQSGYTGPAHNGTPDLYMPTASFTAANLGVPLNISGNQPDHSGGSSGYMGLYTYLPVYNGGTNSNYREYVISNFPFQLMENITYTFSFWVSLSDNSKFATPVQAWVGRAANFPVIPGGSVAPVPFTSIPGVTMVHTTPVINNANVPGWTQVQFNFTPSTNNGGSYYLVIGNFQNNPVSPVLNPVPYTSPYAVPYGGNHAYYFIDDINVVGQTCCTSNYQFIDDHMDPTQPNTDINWTSFAPTTISNQTLYVNGHLHVNSNVVLDHVTMNFSPNSSLIVDGGISLEIKNGSVLKGCPDMWNGIITPNPSVPATVKITNSSVLDAFTGLTALYNQNITLKSNLFNNNERAVTFFLFTGPGPVIESNTFTTNGAGLKAPLTGTYGKVGITSFVSNWLNFTPAGAGFKNIFSNLNTGIRADNASIQVSNEDFINIGLYDPNNAYAIYSTNSDPNVVRAVAVNNNFGPVNILGCRNGIYATGNCNPEIHHVTLTGNTTGSLLMERAIWMQSIPPFTASTSYHGTVFDNTIRNATYGVGAYLCNQTKLLIENNDIKNTVARTNSYGVYVANTVLNNINPRDCIYNGVDVFENVVHKFQTGIFSQTCNCLEVDKNSVEMQNPSTDQYHGILTNNSPGCRITNNNILGLYTDWRSIGLRHGTCPQSLVQCNIIEKTGYAIWLEQNSNSSGIVRNYMKDYDKGIFFTGNAIIGNQTAGVIAHKNSWLKSTPNPNAEFYTDGSANMSGTTFYFDNDDLDPSTQYTAASVQNLFVNPGTAPFLDNSTNLVNTDNTGVYCGFPQPIAGNGFADLVQQPKILDHHFAVYEEENTWLYQQYLLRQFAMHKDTLVYLTIPETTKDAIHSLVGTSSEKVVQVDDLIGLKKFDEALKLNASINDGSAMGNFYRQLNEVLIPYYKQIDHFDTIHVSIADSSFLCNVASLCPWQWGNGVWQARVFLQQHVSNDLTFKNDCETSSFQETDHTSVEDHGEPTASKFIANAYPNPGDDVVYLSVNVEGINNYQLIDINGKVILGGNFELTTTLATKTIPNGIYIVVLHHIDLNKTQTIKLVVNHD